jgi:hypothetical protein
MAYSPTFVRRIVQVLNALCSIVLVVNLGIGTLLGTLLAGFLISCWAFVYAHVMCAGEHLDLREMAWTAAWGAGSAPVVVLLHIALGSTVVVLLILCAALWIAAVTPTGHLPGTAHQVASWIARRGRREPPAAP